LKLYIKKDGTIITCIETAKFQTIWQSKAIKMLSNKDI